MIKNFLKFILRILRSVYRNAKKPFSFFYEDIKITQKFLIARNKSKYSYILLGMPTYGNLGDHAIGYAEKCFLKDYYPNIAIVNITDIEWKLQKNLIKQMILPDDIVIIIGGGFIGTLWMEDAELTVRDFIQSFKDNKIVIFPQTVYFEQTLFGKKELEITKKIWQNHNDLTVCLRENISYNFVKTNIIGGNFQNVELIPDIVLYLNERRVFNRSGILLLFRSDKECIVDESEKKILLNFIRKYNKPIKITSMVKLIGISESKSEKAVRDKLDEFSQAELIITDRLHGMIFSAITGTPCIAFNNKSRKVEGVYQWIKHLEFIKFAQTVDEFSRYCNELLAQVPHEYDNAQFIPYWDKLSDLIKKETV